MRKMAEASRAGMTETMQERSEVQGEVCGFWRRWDERLTGHIPNLERLFLSLMFMYEVMQ